MIITFHSLYIVVNYGLKIFKNRKRLELLLPQEDASRAQRVVDAEEKLSFDPPVYKQRYGEIQNILLDNVWKEDIKKIVDFGCAEFQLFLFLKRLMRIEYIFEVDIDETVLQENIFRIRPTTVDYLCKRTEPLTVHVLWGNISEPDRRLLDVDVVIGIEIVEHLYPDTLDALPYNIFGVIIPKIVIFTTPNADFNQLFPNFKGFRHYDHKFEWTREQFESWAVNIITRFPDYSVSFKGIGQGPKGTEKLGCCSQMAVFVKKYVPKMTDTNYEREKSVDIICNYKNCELPVSLGICKYFSYTETILQSCNISLLNHESYGDATKNADDRYKTIALVEYPYDIDERSTEEKILDELRYRIRLMGNISGRFYDEEENKIKIPINEVIFNQYTTFTTVSEAREILEKAGFKIEECIVCKETETCVIYEPEMESRSSTPVSGSRDDSSADKEYYAEWTAGTTEGESSDWEVDSDMQRGVWIVDFDNQETQGEALENANEIVHDLINNVELLTSTQQAPTSAAQQKLHLMDGSISNKEEGKIFGSVDNSCDLTNVMYDSGYYKSNTNLTTSPQSCSDVLDADILDDSIHSEVNTSDKRPVPANVIVYDNEHAVFCKDFKLSCHKRKADAVDLTEDTSLGSTDRCHIDNSKNFYVHDSNDDKSSFVKSAATVGDLKVAISKSIVCNNTNGHSFKENVRECNPGGTFSSASKECSPGTSEPKKRKKFKKFESDDDDVAVSGLKIEGVDMKVRIDDRENRDIEAVPEAHEAVQVIEPVVENGDLANNNRDLEGNNYPNAEHNNEGNDNEHVVFQNNIEAHEIVERNEDIENRNADVEDEEVNNEPEVDGICLNGVQPAPEFGLEHASREALFDPNSVVDLLENFDDASLESGPIIENLEEAVAQNVIVIALGGGPLDNNVGPVIPIDAEPFPHWLLHLLGTDFADDDQHHDEPHFYCQGDGIGVHPSFIDADFEEENSSSDSDSSSTAASGTGNSSNTTTNTVDAAEAVPTVSEADVGSLPEDANDVVQEQNVLGAQGLNTENLQSPVVSNAGSSSGTESADEYFDSVDDALSTNSSRSEKSSTAANQTKSLR